MKPATGDYVEGVRVMLPLLPGAVPFGMIAGAVAAEAKFGAAAGIGQSIVIYAGAAQLASTQLIADAAPALIVVLTGLVINLRFAMYSASLAPHFAGLSLRRRAMLAYLMTDQSYALGITRYTADSEMTARAKARFYLGGAIAMWVVWLAATAAGFTLGSRVPPSWSLDFFVPLSFLALLVPGIRDRAAGLAAVTGATVAVAASGLPFNLGLFLAAACGIAAGYFCETRWTPKKPQQGEN
ncbi:MAG: AzlC family ABC transporter permease [Parvibaculum sp.]|nr:AzlC family ABC transporter permease [Parvibaculum sp.]